jgi:hypothetical protein
MLPHNIKPESVNAMELSPHAAEHGRIRLAKERAENMEADVMLVDEVAARLRVSVKQIRRLEQRGAFPIPRLPKLDRTARYSRTLVERFAAGDSLLQRRRG